MMSQQEKEETTNLKEDLLRVREEFIEFYKLGFLDGYMKGGNITYRPSISRSIKQKRIWDRIKDDCLKIFHKRFKKLVKKEIKRDVKNRP